VKEKENEPRAAEGAEETRRKTNAKPERAE
jgi:hypothetical protein